MRQHLNNCEIHKLTNSQTQKQTHRQPLRAFQSCTALYDSEWSLMVICVRKIGKIGKKGV